MTDINTIISSLSKLSDSDYTIPDLTEEKIEGGYVDKIYEYFIQKFSESVVSYNENLESEKKLLEVDDMVFGSVEEEDEYRSEIQSQLENTMDRTEYVQYINSFIDDFNENNSYELGVQVDFSNKTESIYLTIFDSEGDILESDLRISAHSRPGHEKNCVIKTDPNPYNLRDLPMGPEDNGRFERGWGELIPNKPNPEAETDQHPEFYNKTDLVREPDYGQGQTMNVGINL